MKPQFLEGVLNEIKDSVKEKQIFISIAPGKTLQWLGNIWEKNKSYPYYAKYSGNGW